MILAAKILAGIAGIPMIAGLALAVAFVGMATFQWLRQMGNYR